MYQIYCDNVLIGDSRIEELCVINPIAELEINSSGWFNFTFPATHPHINTINPLTSVIKVLRDNKLIFQGFCSNPSEDIFGNKTITCEGELSYFNDSILRQAKYTNINARTLLQTYINLHNSQVEPRKQFTLGRVNTDFVSQNVYCFTNMQSTLQEIKEDLIDDFGGYISVRYEDGVKYIDYLSDSDSLNSQQTIELGKNLITYNSNIDNTVIATRVIPLGTQLDTEVVEGLPARLDIKSVNSGRDYLDNANGIANFGTITRVVTWDDITVASNLKTKGQQWLLDNQFENVTIDITAIDLSVVDSSFQPFQLFDKVHVISRYHGMDKWFMISKVRYDLANPEKDTYTLGKTYRESLTVKANNTVSNIEKVREETSGMETSWLKKAKQQASDLISGVDGGYVVLNVDNQGRPFELLVMDTPTKETARKVWRWNQNGFGYSSTGYQGTYGTAITMNGEIVADYVKAGTIQGISLIGNTINNGNGTFQVTPNGAVSASNMSITGGGINFGNDTFKVTNSGAVSASNMSITGGDISLNTTVDDNNMIKVTSERYNSHISPYAVSSKELNSNKWGQLQGNGRILVGYHYGSSIEAIGGLFLGSNGASISLANDDGDGRIGLSGGSGTIVTDGGVYGQDANFGSLSVSGTKNRVVKTQHFGTVALSAYETPKPIFSDVGHGKLDEFGVCYIYLDDELLEVIEVEHNYWVFLSKQSRGDIWVEEIHDNYFVVKGEPGMEFDWKIDCVQKGYSLNRFEKYTDRKDMYDMKDNNYIFDAKQYLSEFNFEEELA